MTTTALALTRDEIMERVITAGDLSRLTPRERSQYYLAVCDSVGLNPLTRPFDYLTLNGKTVLYSRKEATDQLRAIHRVSLRLVSRETVEGVMVVTARAQTLDGRDDESTGAVSIQGLKGEALANAIMKSETKAKRRVTLSICGLSGLDESEIESIPGAQYAGYGDDSYPAQVAIPAPRPTPKSAPAPDSGTRGTDVSKLDAHLDGIKSRLATAEDSVQVGAILADLQACALHKAHPRRREMAAALQEAQERVRAAETPEREPGEEG